jgi:hypothetical protein
MIGWINMNFDNPYDYLQWEYTRLNAKQKDLSSLDLDDFFEKARSMYGAENSGLYESDKTLFKGIREEASKLDLPIKEQDRHSYWLLQRHSQNVIQVAKENNIHISGSVVLGTLPITDLDAFVHPFPQEVILVALSQGLFQFLYLMGRVVSSFFTRNDDGSDKSKMAFNLDKDTVIENLRENRAGHAKFIEAIILYYAYRDLSFSKTYYEKDQNLNLSGLLWDTAEFFIVAHEYAHIILDHLAPKEYAAKRYLSDDSMLYKVIRNWSEELSADGLAFQLVMAYNQKSGYGLLGCYLGIEFVFACLNILGSEASETHPSNEMRINNIRQSLKNSLPQKSEMILEQGKVIEDIINELWNRNKKTIQDLYNHLSK